MIQEIREAVAQPIPEYNTGKNSNFQYLEWVDRRPYFKFMDVDQWDWSTTVGGIILESPEGTPSGADIKGAVAAYMTIFGEPTKKDKEALGYFVAEYLGLPLTLGQETYEFIFDNDSLVEKIAYHTKDLTRKDLSELFVILRENHDSKAIIG